MTVLCLLALVIRFARPRKPINPLCDRLVTVRIEARSGMASPPARTSVAHRTFPHCGAACPRYFKSCAAQRLPCCLGNPVAGACRGTSRGARNDRRSRRGTWRGRQCWAPQAADLVRKESKSAPVLVRQGSVANCKHLLPDRQWGAPLCLSARSGSLAAGQVVMHRRPGLAGQPALGREGGREG